MKVKGFVAATRAEAGDMLLKACQIAEEGKPMPVGDYRGFLLEGGYDPTFKLLYINVVGAVKHKVELGDDGLGNTVRIDNAIDRIGVELEEAKEKLGDVRSEIASARREAAKPFASEQELKEKMARLAQISAELDVGKTDTVPVDEAPEKDGAKSKAPKTAELSR